IEDMIRKKQFLKIFQWLMPLMLMANVVHAQVQISALVKGSDNNPLSGVSIDVMGGQAQASSDNEGRYTSTVESLQQSLRFSYIGMKGLVVPLEGKESITVVMEDDSHSLSEVVVIGYGQQSRATLTTSISKVDDKVLENIPFSNPASALQGTVSGLRVQSTSGQPGQAPRVILRGSTSINNP